MFRLPRKKRPTLQATKDPRYRLRVQGSIPSPGQDNESSRSPLGSNNLARRTKAREYFVFASLNRVNIRVLWHFPPCRDDTRILLAERFLRSDLSLHSV